MKNMNKFVGLILKVQNENKDPENTLNDLKQNGFSEKVIEENVKTLMAINKKELTNLLKVLQNQESRNKGDKTDQIAKTYSEQEIYLIFENTEEYIRKQLKVSHLKDMYRSIYHQEPRSKMKKDELISTIKNRIRVLSRAKSFTK